MASADKSQERVFIRELLKLYQSQPALWNASSKEYTDRAKKALSYNILLTKYCERYPSATRDDLRKKINALRTNYRKARKEVAGNKPKNCWYYEYLEFLDDPEQLASNQTSIISGADPKFTQQATVTQAPVNSPNVSSVDSGSSESEHMRIAWVWANELAKASPEQQMYAKKAVNDILFEAQMGTLTRHSVSINESPEIVHYYSSKGQE